MKKIRPPAGHQIALGETAWRLWRDACIRSAGFPARRVLALCDDDLAEAADRRDASADASLAYEAAYATAVKRLPRVIADTANDPLFREALIWQNPVMARSILAKARAGETRNVKAREGELRIAAYLQRYCLKNDTIGFFGPVGWTSLTGEDSDLAVIPGGTLLAARTTYFETWAIDEVARVIAGRAEVSGWLRPRRDPSGLVLGDQLHLPGRRPVLLSAGQLRMLMHCDGNSTVSELLDIPDSDAPELLTGLQELGAVRIDLAVPVQARPELWLREEIERIGEPAVRDAALRTLEELTCARDAVAVSAGDPDKLQQSMDRLGQAFERITGSPPSRRPGELYAGRTLVYEDTVRDVEVRLGRLVTGELAAPLGLVLDSACWLVGEIADRYRALFLQLLERECRDTGTSQVPLSRLIAMATPDLLTPLGRGLTEITARAVAKFQARWQEVLRIPGGATAPHSVSSGEIAGRAAELFPPWPAAWSLASQHSPDLMIATASLDALRRGEFLFVLGELHLAANTLESRCFVEQHPDQERLLNAATADHGARRIVAIPAKHLPFVTSRLNPPTALLSPEYTYCLSGNEAAIPPQSATVLPAASLLVSRDGGKLVVRCASSRATFDFLEVIGDLMSSVTANAFAPVAPCSHHPRIAIDRLVLSREGWTFPVEETPWVFVRDEATRYARARQWRSDHRLPERIFYQVPVEHKPVAADFRSLVLVNLLAKSIRRTRDAGYGAFRVTEMLPDVDQLWLADAAGECYSCELRLVATSSAGGWP